MKNTFDLRKFLTENKNSIKEENINELTGDQQEAIIELQSILDEAAQLGEQAREIIRDKFPRMLSKGDAYGAFEFGSSANSYDTTLSSIIEEIQEYYDEEEYDEEDLDEEVINEDIEWFNLIPLGLGAVIGGLMVATGFVADRAIQAGLNGKFGDKVKNYLEKKSNEIKDFLDNDRNVQEDEMEESAPGYDHDCAAHVVHETYGYGLCLEGRHTLVETSKGKAKVTHYDVFFKNGSKIVENIPVEDLVIESIEEHYHGKRKK